MQLCVFLSFQITKKKHLHKAVNACELVCDSSIYVKDECARIHTTHVASRELIGEQVLHTTNRKRSS